MRSIRPKTYNELMRYQHCVQLMKMVPEIDEALFVKIYNFLGESRENNVWVSGGRLAFYRDTLLTNAYPVISDTGYISIALTAAGIKVERPVSNHGGDSGSSGNNNNNNNNNNNG